MPIPSQVILSSKTPMLAHVTVGFSAKLVNIQAVEAKKVGH